jgi:hypothetical protein
MPQLAAVIVLAPLAGAVGVLWLSRRFLQGAGQQSAGALSFGIAFWLGYALLAWLQLRSDFAPARHWQWIPYLTILAAAVGAVISSVRMPTVARWILIASAAIVSAWFLVPTWPDLEPRREITLPLFAVYLFLLSVLLDSLNGRLQSSAVTAQLALSAFCSAAMIAALVSLTYGEPAVISAAALAGCAVGAWLYPELAMTRALALVYAVNVGGWAFTGAVNPRPPLFALLIAPLAPIALWVCAVGPLGRKRGLVAIVLRTTVVLAVLAIAGAWAWFATSDGTDGEW